MLDPLRQEIAALADPLVVKIGTRPITRPDGTLDEARIAALAEEVNALISRGRRVVLVSSGAVGAGMGQMGLTHRPADLPHLQATAAIGQSYLIQAYERSLRAHGHHAAQILLTTEDLNDRTRYLNVRNTLSALLEWGAVPIINENDTVSTDELQLSFGDNDRLAALVTNLIRAPLLVLLSDVDGLYDGDPSDPASKVLSVVIDLNAAQSQLVYDDKITSKETPRGVQLSLGGMASKLQAVQIATSAGENVVIANGRQENVLQEILSGADIGTLILAEGKSVASRKRWIGWSAQPSGQLTLDAGALRAIQSGGSSLLAVGVTLVEGDFSKGDVVALGDADGNEIARGLINYSADEMRTIAGQTTGRIAELLGHCPYDEVVHRDNLVLL